MIFSSVDFFVFFAVFLLLYRALPHRPQNHLILVASYVFYSWWDWRFSGLILLMSLVDAVAAVELGKTDSPLRRKAWVVASLSVNLGVLGFFKYFNFFVDATASALQGMGFEPHLTTLRLILPVGVSFFTFQCDGISPSHSTPESFMGTFGSRPLVTARVMRAARFS